MQPARIVGLLLVLLGATLLVVTTTGIGGEVIVLVLGAGFLVAYAATRSYGLLIPGAILSGLGAGILASSGGVAGDWPALGLGVGFLAIAVLDRLVTSERSGWWWPLIPGGIITVAASTQLAGVANAGRYVGPIAVIVIGLFLLLRGGERAPQRPDPVDDQAAHAQEVEGREVGSSSPPEAPPRN